MRGRDIIVNGASASGDEADAELLLRAEAAQRRADPVRRALTDHAENDREPAEKMTGA